MHFPNSMKLMEFTYCHLSTTAARLTIHQAKLDNKLRLATYRNHLQRNQITKRL